MRVDCSTTPTELDKISKLAFFNEIPAVKIPIAAPMAPNTSKAIVPRAPNSSKAPSCPVCPTTQACPAVPSCPNAKSNTSKTMLEQLLEEVERERGSTVFGGGRKRRNVKFNLY